MAMRGPMARKVRQAKACARKKPYLTRQAAEADRRAILSGGNSTGPINVYQCAVCSAFHIGATPTHRNPDR